MIQQLKFISKRYFCLLAPLWKTMNKTGKENDNSRLAKNGD